MNYMRYLYRMKIPYISPLFVKHFGKSVKMMIAFENEMAKLKAITSMSLDNNNNVKDLINWFRKEYEKRLEKYLGDHVALSELRNQIAKGLSIEESLDATYKIFEDTFKVMDFNRCFRVYNYR